MLCFALLDWLEKLEPNVALKFEGFKHQKQGNQEGRQKQNTWDESMISGVSLMFCSHLARTEGDKAESLALIGDRMLGKVHVHHLQHHHGSGIMTRLAQPRLQHNGSLTTHRAIVAEVVADHCL